MWDYPGLMLPRQGKGVRRGSVLYSSHWSPWEPLWVQEDPAPPKGPWGTQGSGPQVFLPDR